MLAPLNANNFGLKNQMNHKKTSSEIAKETLKKENLNGFLMNTYIKNSAAKEANSWDSIDYSLPKNSFSPNISKQKENEEKKELFSYKNTLKPLIAFSAIGVGIIGTISLALFGYSKKMANTKGLILPPDIPRSMNIVEEHQLAMYRALRHPDAKNILGLIGVGIMSAFTLCASNFVEGIKEIWIKKQEFDIEHDFQQELIEVEKNSFAGKLDVVNNLYNNTSRYFKNVFDKNKAENIKNNISFTGKTSEDEKEQEKAKNKKPLLWLALGALGATAFSFALFKNYQKTIQNLQTFVDKTTDSTIRAELNKAIEIEDKEKAIKKLSDIFKISNMDDEAMKQNLSKIQGITDIEIDSTISQINKERTYVTPPEALAGVAEKIQYYCFIDEERGHLYNWILNPENKFNKYLFLSFCLVTSIGYLSKNLVDAIKKVTVQKQNVKNELNLKKEMVEVEINNFKAKKDAAINPLIENFNQNLQNKKDEEKLKQEAENILLEIKTGPPYIYF